MKRARKKDRAQKTRTTAKLHAHELGGIFGRARRSVVGALLGAGAAATLLLAMPGRARADEPRRDDRPADHDDAPPRASPPPPTGASAGAPFTLERDGRRINLIPTFAELESWGLLDPHPVPQTRTSVTAPSAARPDEPLDLLLQGVSDDVRREPWAANFDEYFRARAAVSEVPVALAGMALQPVGDKLYRVVDMIPAPIRRPFDRALGILLENAVSLPAMGLTSRLPFDGGPLPASSDLRVPAYPQIDNACGETMVATYLKSRGVPIALGEVDTQIPFYDGSNALEDPELRNRGFSIISGPGTFQDLKTYIAHGYPVMASVGWANGGGHYVVVSGYDDKTNTLSIDNWFADGKVAKVPYGEFQQDWARHLNVMTIAGRERDARLETLRRYGRISRPARVQEGLSISEIWVTERLRFFVEAAYRYRGTRDDLVVRLNYNDSNREYGATGVLGGSVRYAHRFDDGTEINFYAERLTTQGPPPDGLVNVLKNSAAYVGASHGPFSARAGYDHGAFQAALQAELNRRLGNLGAEARVNVAPDGNYYVFFGATGTF
jgi:hypothetical protein